MVPRADDDKGATKRANHSQVKPTTSLPPSEDDFSLHHHTRWLYGTTGPARPLAFLVALVLPVVLIVSALVVAWMIVTAGR